MADTLPQLTHTYQNHHLDSTRWSRYIPRDDDIIIATSYKSGTTWMQMIVKNLILSEKDTSLVMEISPWIDGRRQSLDDMIGPLEAQEHRRFIKTHLPLDGLPYYPQVKYIVIGRDARDVFMSLWNHYSHYTKEFYQRLDDGYAHVEGPMPRCPDDIRAFWEGWTTRGWFHWESEGYPFWSNLGHIQSWWPFRHLPNNLFVHFNDLLNNLEGEILRVADFLDIEVPESTLPSIVHAVTFSTMKRNAEQIFPTAENAFNGGAQTFFNKGTNGRWREVLTDNDLELHESAVARILSPDCAQWLEHGRLASGL